MQTPLCEGSVSENVLGKTGEGKMAVSGALRTVRRAGQLARVASAASRVARSSGDERVIAKRALSSLLADARGVPMKIGQFLSDGSENDAFAPLVEGVDAQPLSVMGEVLDRSLGRRRDEVFRTLEESEAAASLGQVHRGTLLDGTDVAVKIRYPDIADAVRAELKLAGLLPGVGPARRWGFNLDSYKCALRDNMERELDYALEAEQQQWFRVNVPVPGLVVPQVMRAESSGEVLVQSWETGERLSAASEWSVEERRHVAQILMKTFVTSLLVAGRVHCDPHMGNMFVRRNGVQGPEVVLLDYGCMIEITERERLALLKLILGSIENDETDPLACFAELGFDVEKLVPIANMLPAMCRILFEPFSSNDPFSTKMWCMNERTNELLGDFRWWFRSAGPARLFLLMRAFSGTVAHLETLKITVSWKEALLSSIGPELAAKAREFEPRPVSEGALRSATSFSCIAKHLNILVTENDRQVVKVAMPAGQVAVLRELIPDDVLLKVESAGIDLDAIRDGACKRGVIPEELFSLEADGRRYRVWLD